MAEHVASLPVDQAVTVLLPHLWYDPDWEYAAPAAIAMHPQHDQLLRDLICRATRSDQIPGDLSVLDAGWEFRGLLARVAAESSEADWSPEAAGMIGQARVELARSGRFGDLGGAAHWRISDRQAREALLGLLPRADNGWEAGWLAVGLAGLDPTAEDKRQVCEALLGLLAQADNDWEAGRLADGLARLDPTAEDKRQAREALLGLLAQADNDWDGRMAGGRAGPAGPDGGGQAPGPRGTARAAGPRPTDSGAAGRAGGPAGRARPTAEDKRQAREALLGLLARPNPRPAGRRAGGRAGPARPDGGGQAPGPRGTARAAAARAAGWGGRKRRTRWPSSTRRRRTSARSARHCSCCWPGRPTAG